MLPDLHPRYTSTVLLYKKIILVVALIGASSTAYNIAISASSLHFSARALPSSDAPLQEVENEFALAPVTQIASSTPRTTDASNTPIEAIEEIVVEEPIPEVTKTAGVFTVPFFSQFTDITSNKWKKVGCGIASLAMLIDFYKPGNVTVDTLLEQGITAHAFLTDAGWTHAGLIGLSKKYGLGGASHDMAGQSMETAFTKLKDVLKEGPVMVSVHYTFDPKNPIPHLVVVNGVSDGMVYYNDPAESKGGGAISITKFQNSWKKRYIEIRPT